MNKEYEVKVLYPDLEQLESLIKEKGATLIGHFFQRNYTFDHPKKLINTGSYLRIREELNLETKLWTKELTFKENIENCNLRENNEFNVNISSAEKMELILKKLGFIRTHYGEKKRKSYRFLQARFDFDEWNKEVLPFPYLEIEVKDERMLNEIISTLNIDRNLCTKASIIELQKLYEDKKGIR